MAPAIKARGGINVPLPGEIVSVMLSLAAATILTLFLTQRALAIRSWRRTPYVVWLVFAVYIDSYLFVFATAILQHSLGVNTSLAICESAIILCLVFYVSTKVFIYLFLVEKAYIIRGTKKPRLKSKLYLINSFGMLGIYVAVVILNFVFRIMRMENGQCIIGMRSIAMIPLISFDTVVNVYLTILFLIPLKNLYSYKNTSQTKANLRLRTIAFRTFIGSVCTLISSIVNLSVLMALNGEPGWVCLMCCNSDILFSAVVVQWITSRDNAATAGTTSSHGGGGGGGGHASHGRVRSMSTSDFDPNPISLVTTARGSNGTDVDSKDNDGDDHSEAALKGSDPGGVIVTTTIEHEINPRGYPSTPKSLAPTYGYKGPVGSEMTPADVREDAPPRTRITGGFGGRTRTIS